MSAALTILGIETSCDETAAAVVRVQDGQVRVLSSVIASQIAAHAPYGGVVPEIAARAHVEVIDAIIAKAMDQSGLDFDGLDGVAATAGPGLVGGVMVGLSTGKAIALARGLPLMAVNHLEGHALSVRLTQTAPYPFLLLLVSGGHCQLLSVSGVGQYRRLGATIDDAAGEAFDKIASALGMTYPGGPALEKLAIGGDPTIYDLPGALRGREGCDFSFSGLKTAASRIAVTLSAQADRRDLAAAVQFAIARQLAHQSQKAMVQHRRGDPGARPLFVVAGGVAANQTVRSALQSIADIQGFAFAAPALDYCTDNAAMIALAGAERLAAGLSDSIDVAARPRWPLDEGAARDNPIHGAGRKGAKA